ncbi:MAG: heme-dependent oxidative N-demethylase family protein [Geminicoccaceae bacterium]
MARYRPFLDGPWRLAMGIKALDLEAWIELDERFLDQLAERRRLLAERPAEVMAALPESRAGQRELLELLLDHLPERFPEHYRRRDGRIENRATGESFEIEAWAGAPLELAGRLVQEDLCLMQRSGTGYRLVAAVLCFPAHWRLADKLGRPLEAIHAPVPGFGERLAAPVDRFFGNIQVERPVWRVNWSLVDTPALFLPPEHRGQSREVAAERAGEELWLRVERQTLRRLPRWGDVVFGIHTYVHPLADAIDSSEAAGALAARVREMPEPMARYKSILPIREPLLAWLDARAQAHADPAKS